MKHRSSAYNAPAEGRCFYMERGFLLMVSPSGLDCLTQGRSAALLPLLDEPLAGLMLHLLRRHGVKHVTVVSTDDAAWRALGDGSLYGLQLSYCSCWPGNVHEPAYLMNANILTDADLTVLAESVLNHRTNMSEAGEFAAVSADMLSKIPEGTSADDVLPMARCLAESVTSLPISGYCCVVNDPVSYRQAQQDLLSGKVGLPVRGSWYGRAIVARGGAMPRHVQVRGRCFVGHSVQIGQGCILGQGTVISSGAQVGRHTCLENTCLMENTCVDSRVLLRNALVFPDGQVYSMTPGNTFSIGKL